MKEKIWEPVQIGTIKTKNRIVMAPMCTRLANPDGSVSPQLIEYYEARAAGGAGIIIIEYTYIDDVASKAAVCQLGVYNDNLIPGLSVILAAGFIAKTELARMFEGVAPEIYPVGDCRKPGKIFDAINYAALVASRI